MSGDDLAAHANVSEPPYTKTYRVRGIPLEYEVKQTEKLLRNILSFEASAAVWKLGSLAANPDGQSQVATVDVYGDEPLPLKGVDERTFEISDTPGPTSLHVRGQNSIQRSPRVTVDKHFHGFTVLNHWKDKSEHYFESVYLFVPNTVLLLTR